MKNQGTAAAPWNAAFTTDPTVVFFLCWYILLIFVTFYYLLNDLRSVTCIVKHSDCLLNIILEYPNIF